MFEFNRNNNISHDTAYSLKQKFLIVELVKVIGGDMFKDKEKLGISQSSLDNLI